MYIYTCCSVVQNPVLTTCAYVPFFKKESPYVPFSTKGRHRHSKKIEMTFCSRYIWIVYFDGQNSSASNCHAGVDPRNILTVYLNSIFITVYIELTSSPLSLLLALSRSFPLFPALALALSLSLSLSLNQKQMRWACICCRHAQEPHLSRQGHV